MNSFFTKHKIIFLGLLPVFWLLNFTSLIASEGGVKRANPTWVPSSTVSYDFCSGNITAVYPARDDEGYDDYVTTYRLYYTDGSGTKIKFYDNGFVKGSDGSEVWRGTISDSKQGDVTTKTIVWKNNPNVPDGNSYKITSEVHWTEGYAFEDEHFNQTDDHTLIGFDRPGQPSNISVASDECNQVTISFDHPNINCNTTRFVRIWRGNTHLGDLTADKTSFVDKNLAAGTKYTYYFQGGYYYNNGDPYVRAVLSANTIGYEATTKAVPTTPSGIEASTERCDKKIKLEWQWYEEAPGHFKIERSTSPTTGFAQVGGNIAGGKRSFLDENVNYNTKYYYRISASGSLCGDYGAVSDVIEGLAPNEPTAPSNVTLTKVEVSGKPSVKIDWTDNSVNESGFLIKRVFKEGGGEREFTVDAGVKTFTDTEVGNCIPYVYEVYAYNICTTGNDGVIATNLPEVQIDEDIKDTFDGVNKKLKASKGYYTNRVELSWTNNNGNLIDQFNIYRRVLGDTDEPVLIATQNSTASLYADNTTDAGVLYEYFIIAEGSCGDNTIYSETIKANAESAIGFRSPSGIINGSIAYTGGIAVEGAKVLVERSGGNTGKSLAFNGNNQYVQVADHASLNPTSGITVSVWIKSDDFTGSNTYHILSKGTAADGKGYRLKYNNASKDLFFEINNGHLSNVSNYFELVDSTYINVTATYDGNEMILYINGAQVAKKTYVGTISTSNDPLYIGGHDGNGSFKGNIDEVQIYNIAKDSASIARDYSRFLNDNENGIVGYWRIEAGEGSPYIFDASRTGSAFNANDGELKGNTTTEKMWSSDIPAGSQLGLVGITSSSGAYTVSNIRYNGVGENFTITPFFGVHSFNPSNKVLFIGDGASVHNGQDFEDISSFKVTGSVKYENTSIFVKDAFLKIDGELIIKAGTAITTDDNGQFEINVPIGEHVITVEKGSHTFSAGRFPESGFHDFQDVISGIEFVDDTKRKIVGRVVGGTTEGSKKPGLGLSKNNIGVATFKIKHQGNKTLNLNTGLAYESVQTDSTTGEFAIELPPVTYLVEDLEVPSNLTIDFGAQEPIDISLEMPLVTEVDTTSNGAIDSVKFHISRNFIHREPLNFDVTNEEGTGPFTGESKFTYTYEGTDLTEEINLTGDPFGYPIFRQNNTYKAKISVFEKYLNSDVSDDVKEDRVPVKDAKITIENALASGGTAANAEIINLTTGDTLYTFKANNPNNARDENFAEFSYTKTFNILIEAGGHDKTWTDVRGGTTFRAFVLGQKALGNSFTTQGPEVVSHVLRDPPGSRSYAFIEKETSTTTTSRWFINTKEELNLEKSVYAGAKFSVGLGVSTATEIENNITLGLEVSASQNAEGEHVVETKWNERFETSAEAVSVGAPSDLYVGRSMNMEFGLTNVISIVPNDNASGANTEIYGNPNSTNFRLVKRTGFFVVPGGYQTTFVYTQFHILDKVIPRLEELRNNLFNTNNYYTTWSADNENFGTNNDDPVWASHANGVSTTTPDKTEKEDYFGASYQYMGDLEKYSISTDSVRWYNQQIKLWKKAVEDNEKAKVNAISQGQPERNISYAGGSTLSYAHSTTKTDTNTGTFEVGLNTEAKLEIEGKVNNVGVGVEQSLQIGLTTGGSNSTSTSNTNSYGYVLQDDEEESFSIDIFKDVVGNGPIFYTRAGESSCPYEDEVKTQFYQPGTVISKATLQMEIPELSANPAKMVNIPADQAASFNLTLTNNSAAGEDMYYELRVLESTNPHGAIIQVDGENPHRQFLIPAGGSINKILTIKKGPVEVKYDSIRIILHSPCQYDPTNADDNIESSVYLSAHFLPTCSPVDIAAPEKNWVANNSFNNKMTVIVNDYDINYTTLQNVQLQYKASASSEWTILGKWWKNKSLAPNPSSADSIPQNVPYITYEWNLATLPDGPYDLRSVAVCTQAEITSEVYSGLIDRVNPTLFGSASPADGILAPNDEISVQFNEQIDETVLTADNFDIRGVLNGSEIRHNASVFFDGTGDNVTVNNMNLKRKSFTIEFWAKRLANGVAQTLFSQGTVDSLSVQIGFGADDKMHFRLKDESISTNDTYTDGKWHHWAIVYDIDNEDAIIYYDGENVAIKNTFVTLYDTDGEISMGKRTFSPYQPFTGNIHGMRIWNRVRSQSKIVANFNKKLSGKEGGLIANWRMDEGRGTLAEDIAKARHATVNADWKLDPQGSGFGFTRTSKHYLEVASPMALTKEHDMTIEFWFKSNKKDTVTFISNGKGDGTDSNSTGWRIGTNLSGHIIVNNNGQSFTATTTDYFDDNWHHFALVVNRISNTLAFVDGELKGSISSDDWDGYGAANTWIGKRGWLDGVVENSDQYFDGVMDEIRMWSLARTQDQIKGDINNKLQGDEIGLEAYFPFEKYTLSLGIYTSTEVLTSEVENAKDTLVAMNGATYSTVTPNIKLPRPVQKVNFIYTTNLDKIILTPTDAPSVIENVILNITTKNVKDLNNNILQSPITWTAYADRNQVSWEDQELEFSKELNDALSFESKIVNTGGNIVDYEINNLPEWLTASPQSGEITPNSTRTISFTVNENVNIGNYEESIMLSTAFGFDERLDLKLNVSKTPPSDWTVNEADYQFSMSIVGQLSIGDVISTDGNDMLAAYVNDEIRGVANLKYIEELDRYLVFLSIYSNSTSGEKLEFKIWNANEGLIHTQVTPDDASLVNFEPDITKGSPSSPITFSAVNTVLRQVTVPEGWKWISFNLTSSDLSSVNEILKNLDASNGDEIKDMMYFDKYDTQNGWIGTISSNGGFKNDKLYKLKLANGGTLEYEGEVANPLSHTINLVSGWNWIPFVSQRNMELSEALGNLDATEGDVIKGQKQFAIYDATLGWIGDLESLNPTEGYMINVQNAASFKFPKSGLYNGRSKSMNHDIIKLDKEDWKINPYSYKENMSIVASIDAHKNAIDVSDYLGAFVDGEIRGLAKPVYNSKTKQYIYFLTIYANSITENIIFKLIDESETNEFAIKEVGAFQTNAVLGSLENPVPLSLTNKDVYNQGITVTKELITTYPNPFTSSLNIEINIENNTHLLVEAFNITGKRVSILANAPFEAGLHNIEWIPKDFNGNKLPKGVYKIKITSPLFTKSKSVFYK